MSIAKLQGFSLSELLTTLTILGILSSFSIPSLSGYLQANAAISDINQIKKLIYHAKSAAIGKGQYVTICVLNNRNSCDRRSDWKGKVTTFFDPNRDGIIDSGETISQVTEAGKHAASIKWRSFNRRGYLQFSPFGLSSSSNGTFTYCSNTQKAIQQLVLNRQGRLKIRDKPLTNASC